MRGGLLSETTEAPCPSGTRVELGLQQEQVLAVHDFRDVQAHGPKQLLPDRGWRQVIVANRPAHLVTTSVELRAANKVQHQELSTRLHMAGDLPQRHRLVTEE